MRPGAAERIVREYDIVLLNVEEDNFPFADDSFDVVLLCEVIEPC